LCAFCPNFEYPETFGLVLAESNAVGTPVIAHRIGAAAEVIGDPRQLLDTPKLATLAYRACRRVGRGEAIGGRVVDRIGGFRTYVERIAAWRAGGRPVVAARPAFARAAVLDEWKALLMHE
jgi:glycosyltransferase involved in cell wall biosynthesis